MPKTINTTKIASKFTDAELLIIYQEYPRKVARQHALNMIRRALALIDGRGEADAVNWLRNRVTAFAIASEGMERKYIPHCGTWMNDGRYDDDDAEWKVWKDKPGPFPVAQKPDARLDALRAELSQRLETMASSGFHRMHPGFRAQIEDRVAELQRILG